MALVMPHLADLPAFDGMAVEDPVDQFARSSVAWGTCVIDGCVVTQDATPDMHVTVSSGHVAIQGVVYTYAGTTGLAVDAASVGDRRDTVVLRLAAGVVTAVVVKGTVPQPKGGGTPLSGAWTWTTAVTTSLPPWKGPVNYGTGTTSTSVNIAVDVVLAEVYVAYNTTVINGTSSTILNPTSGNIVDKTGSMLYIPSADFESKVRASATLDQMGSPGANVSFGGHKAVSIAAATVAGDASIFEQLPGVTIITASASPAFTPAVTGPYLIIVIGGGGGGGAGGTAASNATAQAGGAGGGQGECKQMIQTLTAATGYNATIGAGGAAVGATASGGHPGAVGNNGTDTTFYGASTLTALGGGAGGGGAATSTAVVAGGGYAKASSSGITGAPPAGGGGQADVAFNISVIGGGCVGFGAGPGAAGSQATTGAGTKGGTAGTSGGFAITQSVGSQGGSATVNGVTATDATSTDYGAGGGGGGGSATGTGGGGAKGGPGVIIIIGPLI